MAARIFLSPEPGLTGIGSRRLKRYPPIKQRESCPFRLAVMPLSAFRWFLLSPARRHTYLLFRCFLAIFMLCLGLHAFTRFRHSLAGDHGRESEDSRLDLVRPPFVPCPALVLFILILIIVFIVLLMSTFIGGCLKRTRITHASNSATREPGSPPTLGRFLESDATPTYHVY